MNKKKEKVKKNQKLVKKIDNPENTKNMEEQIKIKFIEKTKIFLNNKKHKKNEQLINNSNINNIDNNKILEIQDDNKKLKEELKKINEILAKQEKDFEQQKIKDKEEIEKNLEEKYENEYKEKIENLKEFFNKKIKENEDEIQKLKN